MSSPAPSVLLPLAAETVESLNASALGQCWANVVERLNVLAMRGASGDRLHLRRNYALADTDKLPCTIVSYFATRVDRSRGTNNEIAVHYQFLVSFFWASDQSPINGQGEAIANWELALVAFSKRPKPFNLSVGGAGLKDCTVDEADALNGAAFKFGVSVQFLIVDYFVRLPYREGL
jgi:hypothetical protein